MGSPNSNILDQAENNLTETNPLAFTVTGDMTINAKFFLASLIFVGKAKTTIG